MILNPVFWWMSGRRKNIRPGHLEGALNVNWLSEDFLKVMDTLPKGKTLFIYCQKGGRSARAAHALDSLGYPVMDLSGGYAAWRVKNP